MTFGSLGSVEEMDDDFLGSGPLEHNISSWGLSFTQPQRNPTDACF